MTESRLRLFLRFLVAVAKLLSKVRVPVSIRGLSPPPPEVKTPSSDFRATDGSSRSGAVGVVSRDTPA